MRRSAPRLRSPLGRLVAALVVFVTLASACGQIEPLTTEEALDRLNVASTKLYAADGSLIANLHGEINRDKIPLEEIPEHVQNAVIAIEDERFWTHRGIDVKSIVRAFLANVSEDDDRLQGGSTLSQQLVKNLYFPEPERTMARKVAEARVTWQFEQEYSKPEILEMYLNTIYFGRGAYGVETAAHTYFRKDAQDLTLAEAAFLAGLIHEPGRYDYRPDDPPEKVTERKQRALDRRRVVLGKMVELGYVGQGEADEAAQQTIELQPPTDSRWNYPYFVDMVLTRLGVLRCRPGSLLPEYDFLGTTCKERQESVYRGGLRIYTTLDPQAQQAAEEAVEKTLPPDLPQLFAALAAIEPDTGYVRALVGGRNYYPEGCEEEDEPSLDCRFAKVNLALGSAGGGSGRQPGSSFKPVVAAEALRRGMSLYETFSSSPFTQQIPGSEAWRVRNYEGSGGGNMSLFEGTVNSVNAVYAHLLVDGVGEGDPLTGAARVADAARELGIDFPTRRELREFCGENYGQAGCIAADDTPSIALGAKEVSPLEMATAYSTFANEGVRVEPTSVVRITDGGGRTLYEADPERHRVLPTPVANAVTHVLTKVVERGTGTRAQIDRPAAGKTGTAQQWRDAWFDGFVPQLAAAVWVGNPARQEELTPANGYPFRITGGSFPALIWQYFMMRALEGVPVERFSPPPSTFFQRTTTPAPELEVPDVLGLAREDALLELTNAGFTVSESKCFAPTSTEGIVVKQTPAGGATAGQGSTIQICLSVQELPQPGENTPPPGDGSQTGPGSGNQQQEPRSGTVPNVVGESRARAHAELSQAGYEMASVRECDPSSDSEAGRVWNQDPAGGTRYARGSTVTVWYNPAGC